MTYTLISNTHREQLFQEYETCTEETINKLWALINNSRPEDWWRENKSVEWRIRIPPETFKGNLKTEALIDKFVEPPRMYIQRLEPRTSYNWHQDYARNASISISLNQFNNSLTLFAERREVNHFCEISPLYYKFGTMYLFNGSKWHCGINYSEETRYLISVSLTRPATIDNALDFLKKL
jgi:hypothetical protein